MLLDGRDMAFLMHWRKRPTALGANRLLNDWIVEEYVPMWRCAPVNSAWTREKIRDRLKAAGLLNAAGLTDRGELILNTIGTWWGNWPKAVELTDNGDILFHQW